MQDQHASIYRGPYVLMRNASTGKLEFVAARRVAPEAGYWVALTPAEIEAAKTA